MVRVMNDSVYSGKISFQGNPEFWLLSGVRGQYPDTAFPVHELPWLIMGRRIPDHSISITDSDIHQGWEQGSVFC
jgi:hypothetical protein